MFAILVLVLSLPIYISAETKPHLTAAQRVSSTLTDSPTVRVDGMQDDSEIRRLLDRPIEYTYRGVIYTVSPEYYAEMCSSFCGGVIGSCTTSDDVVTRIRRVHNAFRIPRGKTLFSSKRLVKNLDALLEETGNKYLLNSPLHKKLLEISKWFKARGLNPRHLHATNKDVALRSRNQLKQLGMAPKFVDCLSSAFVEQVAQQSKLVVKRVVSAQTLRRLNQKQIMSSQIPDIKLTILGFREKDKRLNDIVQAVQRARRLAFSALEFLKTRGTNNYQYQMFFHSFDRKRVEEIYTKILSLDALVIGRRFSTATPAVVYTSTDNCQITRNTKKKSSFERLLDRLTLFWRRITFQDQNDVPIGQRPILHKLNEASSQTIMFLSERFFENENIRDAKVNMAAIMLHELSHVFGTKDVPLQIKVQNIGAKPFYAEAKAYGLTKAVKLNFADCRRKDRTKPRWYSKRNVLGKCKWRGVDNADNFSHFALILNNLSNRIKRYNKVWDSYISGAKSNWRTWYESVRSDMQTKKSIRIQ